MEKLLETIISFIWMVPLVLYIYDRKKLHDRVLKIEQDYVPREEIEQLIDYKTSHLENGINSVNIKIAKIGDQITEMRIDFAKWQERLSIKVEEDRKK